MESREKDFGELGDDERELEKIRDVEKIQIYIKLVELFWGTVMASGKPLHTGCVSYTSSISRSSSS